MPLSFTEPVSLFERAFPDPPGVAIRAGPHVRDRAVLAGPFSCRGRGQDPPISTQVQVAPRLAVGLAQPETADGAGQCTQSQQLR